MAKIKLILMKRQEEDFGLNTNFSINNINETSELEELTNHN
jgi:hypothetical protein